MCLEKGSELKYFVLTPKVNEENEPSLSNNKNALLYFGGLTLAL